ncbi:MAG: MOSC N-terminal beta barrel domain-containing protein [Bacteroidota bacterium]
MPVISELYIYPVKSLGGIAVSSVELTDRGFKYDRRWMLVNMNNEFLTQREFSQMALLQTSITKDGIQVHRKNNPNERVHIPFENEAKEKLTVKIWDDYCDAIFVNNELDQWFSEMLNIKCRLVHMPGDSLRKVDQRYALHNDDITSFSDAYPVLIIAKESLQDLNSRLEGPLPMNRFRPNIVIEDCEPYEEDVMQHVQINGINFYGVKLCARCVMTTIDQDSAAKNKEPLKTLFTYRKRNNNVYFGQNILYEGRGTIKTGDELKIIKRKENPVFEM